MSTTSLKSGAICSGVNPASPKPISVTRKVKSLFSLANSIKSSTNGLISPIVSVLLIEASFVGIAQV